MAGSVHEKALCNAAVVSSVGNLRLFPHQAEDVVCMAAVEKMGRWGDMLTSVGILGEPAGSGKTITMVAHLATAPLPNPSDPFVAAYDEIKVGNSGRRKRINCDHGIWVGGTDEQYVPPMYFPLSVVVSSPAALFAWAEALELGGQRVFKISSSAELREFDRQRDSLFGACDVIIVSKSFVQGLAYRLRFMRVSRLILDDALELRRPNFDIKSCFLWLIEHDITPMVTWGQSVPSCVRSVLGPLCLPGVEDPTPIFVMHSKEEVDVSLGLEYPMHHLYHLPIPQGWDVCCIPKPKPAQIATQLVVRHQMPVWERGSVAELVDTGVRDRVEADMASEECMVCLDEFGEHGVCLLTCCTRLLCYTCVWKIIHTTGVCPTCRSSIGDRGGAVVMISDRLDAPPLNVSHYFCQQLHRRELLLFVLARIGVGGRVLIYADCMDFYEDDLEDLVQMHTDVRVVQFSGSGAQQRLRLGEYQGIGATAIPNQLSRIAMVLSPHQMARGLNLDATTDVIFYSTPSQKQYEHVLSRALNARTSTVSRRGGRRLAIHMLAENEALFPEIKTAYEGIGAGRGSETKIYESGIAQDLTIG